MKGQFRIETISAYITVDDDGTEGVLGVWGPSGFTPLVGADEARLKSLEPTARTLARELKKTITLARFSVRTDIKQIEPDRTEAAHETVRLTENIVGITKKEL
jgi:hypothetical protein